MRVLDCLAMDFDDRASHPDERGLSREDQKFLEFVEGNVSFEEGHYVIPLPFRRQDEQLPSNRSQALSRLLWQRKKMLRDKSYFTDYVSFMSGLVEKGYCEPVPQQTPADGKVWYLPHHGVYHPQKQKLRIVFDCSAKCNGVCLNDALLQGPNLTNNLFDVLSKFRFEPITFVADLEAMFYQVRVPVHDRSYLRFLWFANNDLQGSIIELQMTVHIFGAVSSPSIANFVLKKIASETTDSQVSNVIAHNFYVDDCLCSQRSVPECQSLIKRLCVTFRDGGFRLTKFVSNNIDVLNSIPLEDRAKDVQSLDLVTDDLPVSRALGVLWQIKEDSFGFRIQIKETDVAQVTRRKVLSFICSMYDPFGFIAPVVLVGKAILQQLCREDRGWDEPLSRELCTQWVEWVDSLTHLHQLSIPRCFKSHQGWGYDNAELHVFSDASTVGYGSVAYLRLIDGRGKVNLSFVAGKARLAPLKSQTIPKLELTAATVSVRLACTIQREMSASIRTVYHTDSTFVWHCLQNDKKRFPVFVANRVQFIRDFSQPDQWRYVPSCVNPADEASRGLCAESLVHGAAWLKGPSFLLKGEDEWPSEHPQSPVPDGDTCAAIQCTVTPTDQLLNHFSSWTKLSRVVAIYRRLQKALLHKCKFDSELTASEILESQRSIFRYVQRSEFTAEIEALKSMQNASDAQRKRVLKKSSSIYRLNPFLDSEGLMRVGGRLRRVDSLDEDARHPILLPRKCFITRLIIKHEHERLGHAGRNHVLSSVRMRYWVTQGNAAVRSVISECIHCKRGRGACLTPKMADLPNCRVDDSEPPFSHVGVDYFGPFEVKVGRKGIKRYGVLFTCMASRAIHLEIAPSLDTTAFINALRRFLSRRGPVVAMYSDNATNFVGAVNELRRAFDLNQETIQRWGANKGFDWHFNPPNASHMGGAWERAIGTVRKVLYGVLRENQVSLDDDSLSTVFCEVENIVNSRPLTTVSNDPADLNPLSPNHVILGKSSVLLPPITQPQRADLYARKRWRRVQYLIGLFWSRWRKEFLASLQPRSKWTQSQRNLKVGDIVLIKEDAPRNSWPMAKVHEVDVDDEGVVRSATLKTRNGHLRRPVHKLVVLVAID